MSREALVAPGAELEPEELARYSRHLSLPGVGEEGQRRIANAKVLVIGAGGLGSPIASYLVAAGIGTLGVIDDDTVELSNLQRQTMHRQQDAGRLKVDSVRRMAHEQNRNVQIITVDEKLDESNAVALFSEYDLVIDGSDNFATRYLSNDAAEITGTPLVWGTLFQFSGQVSVFDPRTGPMLRDLFPEIPDADSVPSCAEGGVFGALCGVIGSVMCAEALKLITGIGTTLSGKLWLYDALEATVRTLEFARDPQREPVTGLGEYQPVSCAAEGHVPELTVQQLAELETEEPVLLVDVRESWERDIIAIPHSQHLPLAQLKERGLGKLAHSASAVVFVCKTGARSQQAARITMSGRDAGIAVYSLSGGTVEWARQVRGQQVAY
ncbi:MULTISPECIES: molybdopterin-synthase adenylyltransferase MoeB [Micrococcaceae]|uniref:molybdopterin-synthase adenylyltransferase MoeB n=1 Tax=Micrococcaceae TaxID=1268 RepID=UPI000CFD8F2B|nr:molybdopterin-synthase adenylyltransferase MoeB [Arthrobacter sp. MYb214]PRB78685.1 adenylyltransferase/sulfurtransferase MoeZ [Arthrobacter sp. MYb214]